jgi:hypothetical protein
MAIVLNRPAALALCGGLSQEGVACHIPKVEVAGMHAEFTDHWIRVVRPGEATPR